MVLATINFDRIVLHADRNQEKMEVIQRALGRRVRIRFSQENCLFYLESRSRSLTAAAIVKRFGLIPRREYFQERYSRALGRALRRTT